MKSNKLSLNRTQLQIIAVISMTIDHVAWGFVDFYSPLGQIMHVLGRFTIPIMCFFVAEGFRKTHDLKQYIYRMAAFAAISVIPFYIFFGEEYGYRQNIIFDYLLGLLMLTVLEKTQLKKWQKAVLVALLFVISATVGGWIITPQCFILSFYYGRTFKEKAKWFIISDLTTVAFLVTAICLNQVYHFSHYDWVWWDKFYLLGFMLALPLLYCYNGEKGRGFGGRYFFYAFYPLHFCVLWAIKMIFVEKVDAYYIYLGIHIMVVIAIMVMLYEVLRARPTRGQNAICFFIMSAEIYALGFVIEIIATTSQGYFLACIVQYFGELMMFVAVLLFVSECCLIKLPVFVYLIHIVAALMLMYSLLTTRETGFFYSYIGVEYSHGILKPDLHHSTGFFLAMLYMLVVCVEVIIMCVHTYRHGAEIEKKRVVLILWAMSFCWIPYGLTLTGITGGFEVPALGLLAAGVLLQRCFFNYGILDSVALASENALDKAREGIIVLDERYRVTFHNRIVDNIIGGISFDGDARKNETVKKILDGEIKQITINDHIYETDVETIEKSGFNQGYMIWIIDVTEHMAHIRQISEMANHDALTGLYNRSYFKQLVDEEVEAGKKGCFLMMDMDNFKQINDSYGHQRGDSVLKNLADILADYPEDDMYSCRVGGDEFCAYLRDTTDDEAIRQVIDDIMLRFNKTFRADDDVKCTISIGAVINDNEEMLLDCSTMYSVADGKLYEAKESGKNTYRL